MKLEICTVLPDEIRLESRIAKIMKRVAVIGAGGSGISCARHLSRFPETFQFTVYEQSEQVGGVWVYDNPTPGKIPKDVRVSLQNGTKTSLYRSSIYKNLW